jgi:hypothetical protein
MIVQMIEATKQLRIITVYKLLIYKTIKIRHKKLNRLFSLLLAIFSCDKRNNNDKYVEATSDPKVRGYFAK